MNHCPRWLNAQLTVKSVRRDTFADHHGKGSLALGINPAKVILRIFIPGGLHLPGKRSAFLFFNAEISPARAVTQSKKKTRRCDPGATARRLPHNHCFGPDHQHGHSPGRSSAEVRRQHFHSGDSRHSAAHRIRRHRRDSLHILREVFPSGPTKEGIFMRRTLPARGVVKWYRPVTLDRQCTFSDR